MSKRANPRAELAMKLAIMEGWSKEDNRSTYHKAVHASLHSEFKWGRNTEAALTARYSGFAKLMAMFEAVNTTQKLTGMHLCILNQCVILRTNLYDYILGIPYGERGERIIDALQQCLLRYGMITLEMGADPAFDLDKYIKQIKEPNNV